MMRRPYVIALKKEISRLLHQVKRWERNARYCRALNVTVPIDPVTDAKNLQFHLDELKRCQDALASRALQLGGVHPSASVLTTGCGAFVADLAALSAAVLY